MRLDEIKERHAKDMLGNDPGTWEGQMIADKAALLKALDDADADLKETLRAVLHFFGPEGANKVCTFALKAREIRYDNALIDEIEAGLNGGEGVDAFNTSEVE